MTAKASTAGAAPLTTSHPWTLYLGDCIEGMRELPDKSVDHFITDPPFASAIYERSRKNPGRYRDAKGHNQASASLSALAKGAIGSADDLMGPAAEQIARLCRRWALIFCDVESLHLWRAALELHGMRYVRCGAWVKEDPMPQFSGDRPAQGFEACAIVHAGDAKLRWNGGGYAALWAHKLSKGHDRPDHPCPKPLGLLERLLRDFTDPGELVCDPFLGSGTTAVACKLLGRRFVGWEIDGAFHATATSRLDGTFALPPPAAVSQQQGLGFTTGEAARSALESLSSSICPADPEEAA